jgi:hypothetical protein
MHGEIKLKSWCPFVAEEVIHCCRGMIWRARVRFHGLPIFGSDMLVDGQGAMRWKLLGLFPIASASGPDIARSAAGRVNIESIWLPSALVREEVTWSAPAGARAHARFAAHGETADLDCDLDAAGRLNAVTMPRWGNPERRDFRYADFGGHMEQEGAFNGYTIPTRIRVGWHFGTPRFESEGEFFRATIDDAAFR